MTPALQPPPPHESSSLQLHALRNLVRLPRADLTSSSTQEEDESCVELGGCESPTLHHCQVRDDAVGCREVGHQPGSVLSFLQEQNSSSVGKRMCRCKYMRLLACGDEQTAVEGWLRMHGVDPTLAPAGVSRCRADTLATSSSSENWRGTCDAPSELQAIEWAMHSRGCPGSTGSSPAVASEQFAAPSSSRGGNATVWWLARWFQCGQRSRAKCHSRAHRPPMHAAAQAARDKPQPQCFDSHDAQQPRVQIWAMAHNPEACHAISHGIVL